MPAGMALNFNYVSRSFRNTFELAGQDAITAALAPGLSVPHAANVSRRSTKRLLAISAATAVMEFTNPNAAAKRHALICKPFEFGNSGWEARTQLKMRYRHGRAVCDGKPTPDYARALCN